MLFFFLLLRLITLFLLTKRSKAYSSGSGSSSSSNKKPCKHVSKIVLTKLNNKYRIKEDIINYNRFKYVYNIKNHPIHVVTESLVNFLKTRMPFCLVYNKCPLYDSNLCFKDILIKDKNDTTSLKNNFYFSSSYLYIPQATSLFPYIYELLNGVGIYQGEKKINIGEKKDKKKHNCNNEEYACSVKMYDEDANFVGKLKNEKNLNKEKNTKGVNLSFGESALYNDVEKGYDKNLNESELYNKSSSTNQVPYTHLDDLNNKSINYFHNEKDNFVIVSNVFRKDNIDKLHFPFFTQMDVYIKIKNELIDKRKQLVYFLSDMLSNIFGHTYKWRIKKDTFDFTKYSLQAEIFYNNKWIEILGSGILRKKIIFQKIRKYDIHDYLAVGLGLDRIAMILFDINRIRNLYLYISNTERNSISQKGTSNLETEEHALGKGELEKDQLGKERLGKNSNRIKTTQLYDGKLYNSSYVKDNKFSIETMSEAKNGQGVIRGAEHNILNNSPKKEGIKLKDELNKSFKRNTRMNEKKRNEDFLYFINLYNIKNEERHLSFYASSQWNSQMFIKSIYNFKNIKNINFLKNILLLDKFFNSNCNRMSYTYKFVYAAGANIKVCTA
ncbi:phenylalanine--tRNA ligase [Plasmodium brasilianum]|uniref:Phenylalanine--tRNA ligase, putative n=2 Tax=Plasmodium (Plasmodium) TaxID=418103 RepID=A0A1A8WG83_PLAMA|nr:phenylalanine--tRNA ligase [Plasmodium brasilianum]SBS91086.1 phenylalanine--tRNA ligase, putative [Plasmodium malariae]